MSRPDLSVEAFDRDPYPAYAHLRTHAPVAWMPWAHAHFVTRWDDVQAMAADPVTFSAAVHDSPLSTAIGPNMLHSDGAFHQQMRAPLTANLRPAVLAGRMRAVLEEAVAELIDGFMAESPIDLVHDFAQPLAIRVVTEVTGLPRLDEQTFLRWLDGIAAGASNYERDPATTAAAVAINDELDVLLDQIRREGAPDGSLIAALAATTVDGARMSTQALAATVKLLIIGGMQEPRDLFGYAINATVRNAALRDRVRTDPGAIGPLIEEALRWGSPVGTVTRRTTTPVTLSGVDLPAGAVVAGVLSSANRDERHWDRPDDFDIDRVNTQHLAFNAGVHACVGASLARMQASAAVGQLLAAYPDVQLAGPVTTRGWEFRGPTSIPVRLGRRARAGRSEPLRTHASAQRVSTMVARVAAIEPVASEVVLVTLQPIDGEFPSAEPGAHIDVHLPAKGGDSVVRQYSLTGLRITPDHWQMAVRRQESGRGGSRAVHERLSPGDTLRIGMPRNHFRFVSAPEYVFIAGGIGITPILPMVGAAQAAGVPWRLHYIGSTRASMSLLDVMPAGQVTLWPTNESGRPDLDDLVAGCQRGSRIYCCGPAGLTEDIERRHEQGNGPWAELDVSIERFAPRASATLDPGRNGAFEIELARSGRVVPVAANVTALDALANAGVLVPSTCREGICGSCETRVVAGAIDHRDSVLDAAERQTQTSMMVCVSRAAGDRITLDL